MVALILQKYPGYTWRMFLQEPLKVQMALMAIAAAQGEIQAEEARRHGG